MADYVVQGGESLPEIAADLKIPLELFYEADSKLKERRPNPNVLAEGDRLKVPKMGAKTEPTKSGNKLAAQAAFQKRTLRFNLCDSEGKPIDGIPFELLFKGEATATTGTIQKGKLEVEVPPEQKPAKQKGRDLRAVLKVGSIEFKLRLRRLWPVHDVSDDGARGAKSRLRNLGYAVTDPDAGLDGATRVALATFQADHGLKITGELDKDTLTKVEEIHGC